ncbi:Retaining alpha-galactosidase precursor [Botrimarina colliarenosi]|uniref:Retaining alpha-galactosidase n=1 Tax=Botrimarina colliarenosi TaxID=2528001 RepID=A0A5C6AEB4_9BACT|nr:glycoside hydrolase family 97 protein [Botrimarina colliarenosi]TWT97760.1 Retaining alpha-galactosidase precursor [Botrimarina colliarenosi]
MYRFTLLGCGLSLLLSSMTASGREAVATALTVASPSGANIVHFAVEEGRPTYSVTRNGADLIGASRMGMELADGVSLAERFELIDSQAASADATWSQPWGEVHKVRDHHNELRVELKQPGDGGLRLVIVFRAFDDGVAFRYEIPEQPGLKKVVITNEVTEFALAGDWPAWWIPAYDENRYEYVYSHTPVSEFRVVHTPVTMQAGERTFVSFHEAALVDYSSMALRHVGDHKLKADLFPWSDGVLVRGEAPMKSPWRTIQIADTPSGLVDSTMILNLNEPSKIADTSWIEPGKYVGVWWEMHVNRATWGSGERHGATTENVKRYIDFAAKYGFKGVLVEGWNQGWDGDWIQNGKLFSFTKSYPDFDIAELSRYGAERGVSLIGHHETAGAIPNYESQMEDAFALYERLGVKTVKTGYVMFGEGEERIDENGEEVYEWSHGQYMVQHHQRVIETAAKHHVMIVAHEAIKDTGLRRTWPNFMSRECARGQEYNAWSGDSRNPPEHEAILTYTRMLSGPMDYTPGVFDIGLESGVDRDNDRIPSTLAKQLALYVVLYAPMQMACDLPAAYESQLDAFQFIRDVPTDWEKTVAIDGVIGDYVVTARKQRGAEDWFLGAISDEEARTLEVPLAFLDPGRKYEAQIYRDADDADWLRNPTAYEVVREEVDSDAVFTIKLAPGGGQAVRFKPLDEH